MAQPLVKKDDDRDDEADYSPFLGIEKGAVLQEARVVNDSQLEARRCSQNSGNCRRIAMKSEENNSFSERDEVQEILGNNSLEDLTWLCSLSESELDMLISLKMLVIQRAKMTGYDDLSQKFDLKMLRALGLILMEYLKEKVKDKSLVPDLVELVAFIDCSNLLKSNVENVLSEEEIKQCIGANSRKRRSKRRWKKDAVRNKKRRKTDTSSAK